jgi:hypothetical protein
VEKGREDGGPRERRQERLKQLVEEISKENDASVKEQGRASLAGELIGHLLRI